MGQPMTQFRIYSPLTNNPIEPKTSPGGHWLSIHFPSVNDSPIIVQTGNNAWVSSGFFSVVQVKPPQATKHKRASSIDIPLSADIISTTSSPATSPQRETAPAATGTSLTSWLARKIGGATGTGSGSGTIKSSDKEKSSSASVSQANFYVHTKNREMSRSMFNWIESENRKNLL